MAKTSADAPARIFYGDRVVPALSLIVLLWVGMSGSPAMTSALTGDIFGRYPVGSIFGLFFSVAGALLLIAAGLSITINEAARSACRAMTLPGRRREPHPVAGGR